MASCEPSRTRAYHADLRWRIVYQRYILELPVKDISSRLMVDQSTVRRILQLFGNTGTVTKKDYPESHAENLRLLTEVDQFLIMELVIEKPGTYLSEIKWQLEKTTGTTVSESTICRFLKQCGFTRKKIKHVALQRSEILRAKYVAEIGIYNPESLVFVDETGGERKDAMRKFGYSLCGKPCVSQKLFWRGRRISAIAALSLDGILDVEFEPDSVNTDRFLEFVEHSLLPHLLPVGNPCSIVIMDNAKIHHSERLEELLRSVGALLIYLPPYSPDLTPIESAFSSVKSFMKANEPLVDLISLQSIMISAFGSISAADAAAWFSDCGYL